MPPVRGVLQHRTYRRSLKPALSKPAVFGAVAVADAVAVFGAEAAADAEAGVGAVAAAAPILRLGLTH